jgi:2'-hydroxyisoflavone reductase
MNLLVLGGTGWLGGEIARSALSQGIDVTCVARGSKRGVPEQARLVQADRTQAGAYDDVLDRDWDEVVDVTWQPGQARTAVAALGKRAAHWTYVSSAAVYMRRPGSAPLAPGGTVEALPADIDIATDEQYPAAKIACETAVLDTMGADRTTIARVGLLGGPGDISDRTGYWPGRFRLAGDGPVLVPAIAEQPVSFIDARDFARWLVLAGQEKYAGVFTVTGRNKTMGAFLESAARVTEFSGEQVFATPEQLAEFEVGPWFGPRSLPMWRPSIGLPGFSKDHAATEVPGLVLGPLDDIMRDTLEDEIARGLERTRRAGLTREEELDVLKRLGN